MNIYTCPFCKADLRYCHDEPEGIIYSRMIGVYSRDLDRTVAWRCPDCKVTWQYHGFKNIPVAIDPKGLPE